MKKKVWYISGRMAGDPDYKKKFEDAERRLNRAGYKTKSPILGAWMTDAKFEADDSSGPPTRRDYLETDLFLLTQCDGIIMLPDWRKSEGAKMERHVAEALGLEIIEYKDIWRMEKWQRKNLKKY